LHIAKFPALFLCLLAVGLLFRVAVVGFRQVVRGGLLPTSKEQRKKERKEERVELDFGPEQQTVRSCTRLDSGSCRSIVLRVFWAKGWIVLEVLVILLRGFWICISFVITVMSGGM